ncbi:UNVERIFIED_ORG: Txe/YoeB family toxin of Txe-Axe toxin-antitoxin module [Arthrobacter sp. UYEF13]
MTPDRGKRGAASKGKPEATPVEAKPSPADVHDIVYFQRHRDDDPRETAPGREFLQMCPATVRAKFRAVLAAVAAAPPNRFSGGGYWEKMHGDMAGWYEVRVDGPNRRHYRLFCRLDYAAEGREKGLLVVIDGRDKAFRTAISAKEYSSVRDMGAEYLKRSPRSVC